MALAGTTAFAFISLRVGLGIYWPLPPALLLAVLGVGGILIRRA